MASECFLASWSQLSQSCRVQKALCLCFSVSATASICLGNLFAIFVMLRSGLFRKPPYMIRLSLAIADLLMGAIPASLALYTDIGILAGHNTRPIFFTTDILSKISALFFHTSAFVSVCSLFILSIINLLMFMNKKMKYWQVILGIAFIWILGLAFPVHRIFLDEKFDSVSFDLITLLPTGILVTSEDIDNELVYGVQMFFFITIGILLVTLILSSLLMFLYKQHKTKQTMTLHQENRKIKNKQILNILIVMQLVFILAAVPPLVALFSNLSSLNPVIHYFCWWIFILGSSCNWIIYCCMGGKFREEARKLFSKERG